MHHRNFYVILLLDLLATLSAFYLAYAIRFDFAIPPQHQEACLRLLPWVALLKMSSFFVGHLYQGMWRYTSLIDLFNIVRAVSLSSLTIVFLLLMTVRFQSYPRSVFLLDWGLTILFAGGARVMIRLVMLPQLGMRQFFFWHPRSGSHSRVLIVGAGDTGERVARQLLDSPELNMLPVGFLDERPTRQGKTIHGVNILGGLDKLDSRRDSFDEIIIAQPSSNGREMRRIVAACEQSGKPFRTVPALSEMLDNRFSLKLLRNVTIQDVLKREEAKLDESSIAGYLKGKCVLVTGGGGSIGSELVRQICKFSPEELILVDMCEFNLFQIEHTMRAEQQSERKWSSFLADIRDQKKVEYIFRRFRPQVVFHAAAYKHVPMQELHPWEAVGNNVFGTRNLIQASEQYGVEKFVLVSSDKAVRPTNVMGATKRVGELMVACANRHSGTQFMAVRFGNVIGSSGSVIPIFQEQIAKGGPVTVTHPNIVRYFMSIPEAAQLILQAGAIGKGGEIFLLEMGESIRIAELAKELIRLHGYEPKEEIEIQYTGLRPGEKLYEELFSEQERLLETSHQSIMVLQGAPCHQESLNAKLDRLWEVSGSFDSEHIKQTLQEIVIEYHPSSAE